MPASIVYDDKFYDLDDGWICDEEVGLNDDGVADFIPESESQSIMASSTVRGLNGEIINDENAKQLKLEKKEIERIAKRFKVITPAEFEHNMNMCSEASGEKNG